MKNILLIALIIFSSFIYTEKSFAQFGLIGYMQSSIASDQAPIKAKAIKCSDSEAINKLEVKLIKLSVRVQKLEKRLKKKSINKNKEREVSNEFDR